MTRQAAPRAALMVPARMQHAWFRYWHLMLAAVLAIGLVAALDAYRSRDEHSAPKASWSLRKPGYGAPTFTAALAASNARVAGARDLVRIHPEEWMRHERLARALSARFRLTGSYDDLAEAAAALAKGRAQAPEPSGPLLSDAELGITTHRLAETEQALTLIQQWVVPPERSEAAEAAALAGDVAFYRGDMTAAGRDYAQAARLDRRGVTYRLAVLAKARGDFDGAIAAFRAYLAEQRTPSPLTVANIALEIGAVELARGASDEARRRFVEANRAFPGFWLIEAHLAQAQALSGNSAAAVAEMRRVAQSSQSAEVMDALAMLLRTYGKPAESREWAARADAIWRRRLELVPEAAYGHAVEHEIVFGTPARALDLAQHNLVTRPFGEAQVLLANALIVNGRVSEALTELQRAEASGWRSAPLYALRAQALALAGRESEAEAARSQAQAINPHVFEPQTTLVWFSHG